MFQPIQHKTTLPLLNSISRSPLRRGFLLIAIPLAFAWFALSPTAQAQLPSPTPDGGYPNNNTAEGTNALFSLTTGTDNTAIGFQALQSNTTGGGNTATGSQALFSNTTGGGNTATGLNALKRNATGFENTATGFDALLHNTGDFNTATGVAALQSNTTGGGNTATGNVALLRNRTGSNNTANGIGALEFNRSGSNNTAYGAGALEFAIGSGNIALGASAGANLTAGNNNIDIGNLGVAGEAARIRIGTIGTQKATFVAGISGATVASGATVIVGSDGHLGTIVSSARFKEAIKPMDKASEAILALKPVTFRYKKELDPESIPQFGLVAEQVEKVNPDLVARDADGKINTVRYEAVNAMLLNEFLKEHRKVEEQASEIAQMKKQINALTSTVQKVSDQLAFRKPALQLAANP
jgi:Chaperone of endosialidase